MSIEKPYKGRIIVLCITPEEERYIETLHCAGDRDYLADKLHKRLVQYRGMGQELTAEAAENELGYLKNGFANLVERLSIQPDGNPKSDFGCLLKQAILDLHKLEHSNLYIEERSKLSAAEDLIQGVEELKGLIRAWLEETLDLENFTTEQGRSGDLDYELRWIWAWSLAEQFNDMKQREIAEYFFDGGIGPMGHGALFDELVDVLDTHDGDVEFAFEEEILPLLKNHYNLG